MEFYIMVQVVWHNIKMTHITYLYKLIVRSNVIMLTLSVRLDIGTYELILTPSSWVSENEVTRLRFLIYPFSAH